MDLIPDNIVSGCQSPKPLSHNGPLLSLREVEMHHVARVLSATGWHKGQACEVLGVSRPRLRRLIKQYGLIPPANVSEADSVEDATERSSPR